MEIAREAWGEDLPDWVAALARECAATSQNKVAARLGRSAALVSQVLRRKYAADLAGVEQVFRGVFEHLTVECPSLGTIPANVCRDWQLKAARFVNVNSERVRMYRACNSCPRFKGASK
ncbi:MAG: hypothetical protein Q4615_04365 [Paracoccus aminovorans]|nr:hypothetical protein [Paracoccus aminovorans]